MQIEPRRQKPFFHKKKDVVVMPRYAFVVTDTGFTPGVNGQINALKYYGNDVEYHYLYIPCGATNNFVERVRKNEKHFPNFRPVNIYDLQKRPGYITNDKKKSMKVWLCKFFRYQYVANELRDYDAAVIYDADALILNNIMDYFLVADKTEKVLLPNNDYSGNEHDQPTHKHYKGASSPPLHCWPLFCKPRLYRELLMRVPQNSINGLPGSDMCSVNNSLVQLGLMKDVMVLPGHMWVLSRHCEQRLIKRKINGKLYLATSRAGDRINSVHRRWWFESICRKFIEGPKHKTQQQYALNNVRLFWEFYRYFNLECWSKIEWIEKWGGFPQNLNLRAMKAA